MSTRAKQQYRPTPTGILRARVADLEAQLAAVDATTPNRGELLALLTWAAPLRFAVPGAPTITIHVNPRPGRPGSYCVMRFGWEEPKTLDRTDGWLPLADVGLDAQYQWGLAEALERVPGLLEAESREHAAWQRKREHAGRARQMAAVAEEFLEPVRAAVKEAVSA